MIDPLDIAKIFEFLEIMAKFKGRTSFDKRKWRILPSNESVPRQYNSKDCGVFMCMFIDCILAGRSISNDTLYVSADGGDDDTTAFRRYMVHCLLQKKIV